jgi:hypothetical protein
VIEQAGQMRQARQQAQQLSEADVHRALAESAPTADPRPDPNIPPGTIRVEVVDTRNRPVANAEVQVGVMAEGSDRSRHDARTNAAGIAIVANLPSGESQAYRVNVLHDGAKFSSSPFRLPDRPGYHVRIVRLDTTREPSAVMQLLNRTILEVKEDRIHVLQQAQLVNLSRDQYVFPLEGIHIPLPDGFISFQSQAVMTDQRVAAVPGEGIYIRGSLPPGRTNLVWGYDVPFSGSSAHLALPLVLRTYGMRVEAEAAPGMTMRVEGLPDPLAHFADGRRVLLTEGRQGPTDAISTLQIDLERIPTPSPVRWIAVGAALALFFLAGAFLVYRGAGSRALAAVVRRERRKALLDEAADLERAFEASEIGPGYRDRRTGEILDELAALLRDDAASEATGVGSLEAGVRPTRRTTARVAEAWLYFAIGWLLCGFFHVIAFHTATEDLRAVRAGHLPKSSVGSLELVRWASLGSAGLWLLAVVIGAFRIVTVLTE